MDSQGIAQGMDGGHPAAFRMVQVLVEDATERRLAYEIDLASLINSLKQDIEETEGIPTSQQHFRLRTSGSELDGNRTFQSYGINEESVLYLNAICITVEIFKDREVPSTIDPNITILDLKEKIFVSNGNPVDQQRLIFCGKELEDGRTIADCNIQDQDIVRVVPRLRGGAAKDALSPKAHGVALFNWEGNMRDHKIRGLPLICGEIVHIDNLIHKDWFHGSNPLTGKEGKFPRNRVKVTKIFDERLRTELGDLDDGVIPGPTEAPPVMIATNSKHPDILSQMLSLFSHVAEPSASEVSPTVNTVGNVITNDIPIPMLPAFPYPRPPPQFFTVALGEKGLSFVQVAVSFQPLLMPENRAHVDIVLKCIAVHPRRISSVVLALAFPDNDVEDLHPTVKLGPETTTDIETKDNTAVALDGGLEYQGVSVKGGWKHEVEEVQSATRVTRMKITGLVKNADTAFWSLTEDIGQGGQGGLPEQLSMGFTLGYKPTENRFECRVTSAKDGKEREKYASQKHRMGSFFESKFRSHGL